MIDSISLTGIKSIGQAKVDLAPLTVLIGPNGSGKSTVLEGLELVSRAAADLLSPNASDLYEPRSRAGTWSGRLADDPLKPTRNQGFGNIRGPKPLASVTARVRVGWTMGVVPAWGTVRLTFPGGMPGAPAYFWLTVEGSEFGRDDLLRQAGQVISLPIARAEWPPRYDSEQALKPVGSAYSPPDQGPPQVTALRERMGEAIDFIKRNSARSTRLREIGVGLFGVDWTASHPLRPELVESRTWKVAFEEASFGTRQFFPAVVHLLALQEDQTLLIEEPEISLHPRAQLEAGRLLVEASQNGRQVVATTHSHYLIMGILHSVRRGLLPADAVAILECRKTQQGSRFTRRPVKRTGNIEGWIRQFAQVDEYVFQAWQESLEGQPRERSN